MSLARILPLLSRLPARAVGVIAAAGLCGVVASLVFAKTWAALFPFPGVVPAVISVAILLVAIVAYPQGLVASALAQRRVVYVGRISYSLYLWHWPVFVLMRWTVGFSSIRQIGFGIALSCALAAASYHWVEVPIRSGRWLRPRRIAVICGGVACLLLAAGSVKWATNHQSDLTASITSDRYVWYPEGPTRGLKADCGLDVKADQRHGGIELVFLPVNCSGTKTRRTIFVAGNSHAGAMMRMFANAAVNQGATIRLYSLPGCPVLPLGNSQAAVGTACEKYVRDTLDDIAAMAKPGDVLFLPSLRMDRLQAMDGGELRDKWVNAQTLSAAMPEAEALLRKFDAAGITVVLSAPLPIFRITPYRCSDWFNQQNPICRNGYDMSRSEIEGLRAGVMASMKRLSEEFPYVSVWDPVPVLCDAKTCSAMKDGKPLFFDGDHLSGWGDDVLYPSFMAHMDGLLTAKRAME